MNRWQVYGLLYSEICHELNLESWIQKTMFRSDDDFSELLSCDDLEETRVEVNVLYCCVFSVSELSLCAVSETTKPAVYRDVCVSETTKPAVYRDVCVSETTEPAVYHQTSRV